MPTERKFDKENKQNYDNKYIAEKLDRLNFVMPKGTKEKIQKAAAAAGVKSSEWVRQAIFEKLERS